jgi:exonuclease SbcD
VRERVTFVHAADLHLDAPFQGIAADDDRVGRELAEATYEAWRRIVDLAIERVVDFVVLAGDAYNSADWSLRAQFRFREQTQRLGEAGISTYVVRGNHDPVGGRSAGLRLPDSVHVLSADTVERVEVLRDGDFVCAVYGRSFSKAAETDNLAAGYRREESDTVAIGVLHANVGGNVDYDPYAPCTLDDLRAGGMDYWALGHVHKHEVLSSDPWAVYAGSPQGLNPKEIGTHGCCVVEVERGGVVRMEHVDLAPVGWEALSLDTVGVSDIDGVEALIGDACENLRVSAQRPVVVRVALRGRTLAHAALARAGVVGHLHESIRAAEAAGAPWVWVDRLDDLTASPVDLDSARAGRDFVGEIVAVADEIALSPEDLEALVSEVTAPLQEKLRGYEPSADAVGLLEAARDRCLDALLAEGGDGR